MSKKKEKVDFESPQEEIKYLRNVIAGLRGENTRLNKANALLVESCDKIHKSVTKLDAQNTELTEVIEKMQKTVTQQQRALEATAKALANAREQIGELQKKLTAARSPWWKRIFG